MRPPADELLVSCRAGLIPGNVPPDRNVLLLEGAWDRPSATHWSLDEAIDGRFEWIDRQVEMCAAELIEQEASQTDSPGVSACWLGALELRYHLVKLLRMCAYFEHVRRLSRGQRVELIAETPRDVDYVDLLTQLCQSAGACLTVRPVAGVACASPRFPPNGAIRRWLGGLAGLLGPYPGRRADRPGVVLCGNPRVLDPLVSPILARGAAVWWLYDRFALRSFLRWRWRGVGQLVCNSSQSAENRLQAALPHRLAACSVDLAPAVRRHVERWLQGHGARQSLLAGAIESHFRRLEPRTVVLDQDATPFARTVVAAARAVGARSLVVQHGAPCCRFGFAPLAADAICVWGRSARSQLLRWGVSSERILVTGSPYHDRLRRHLHAGKPRARTRRFLLLATVPPRDERPDAIALHLTRRSYAGVLHASLEGSRRAGCRELVIKLHPRAGDDPILSRAIAECPGLPVRLVRDGNLEDLLAGIDCVLSCGSSAGVDATLSGIPVIQVLPEGASDFLSREPWGLAGIARTADEVESLLAEALSKDSPRRPVPDPSVFGHFGVAPAERIADEILAPRRPSVVPEPHCSSLRSSSLRLHASPFPVHPSPSE